MNKVHCQFMDRMDGKHKGLVEHPNGDLWICFKHPDGQWVTLRKATDEDMATLRKGGMHEVRPALCVDLDGTIRYSKNGEFINSPNDVALFPDVEAKLWEYRDNGFLIFGVSNQGGVAFGHKTWDDAQEEVKITCFLFERNPFHDIKQCFHHEGGHIGPYCYRSLYRKPSIGMLAQIEFDAFKDGYIVDWDKSLFVGDRPEDKQCAENARIGFQWAWEFFGREEPTNA